MILKLHQAGQPVLRKKAKTLTKNQLASDHMQQVIDYMVATLRDAPGVGLAAPQVGESVRLIIIEDLAKYHGLVPPEVRKAQNRKATPLKVIANPKLEIVDANTATFFEGCLSADGYLAAVPRAKQVRVSGLDRYGKPVTYLASGWFARILQHEVDHLNGSLFIDRMLSKSFMTTKNFSLLWRKALEPKIKQEFDD